MYKNGLLLLITFILSSCATELSQSGKNVKIIKTDPEGSCKEIEDIQVEEMLKYEDHCDFTSLKNLLRNEAALKGGNVIRLDVMSAGKRNCVANGAVFLCK